MQRAHVIFFPAFASAKKKVSRFRLSPAAASCEKDVDGREAPSEQGIRA